MMCNFSSTNTLFIDIDTHTLNKVYNIAIFIHLHTIVSFYMYIKI